MAYCPKCKGEMTTTAIECPHCGYNFSESPVTDRIPTGFPYSRLSDVALIVASMVAGFGCVLSVYFSFAALYLERDLMTGLVWCPIAFLYQFAMLVVFIRIQRV